ncbi:MAG TPA: class I SAM-dependent methyltransferase, partial [bacterium]|nr:class I SAM-dependent methyltransferase [bacterium]
MHYFPKMKRTFPALFWFLAVLVGCSLLGTCRNRPLYLDVPYVATPDFVVDRMLRMAEVGPGDYLIDLGSGDGRIVIAAAKRGAAGHGIELDPERIRQARKNALDAQVRDRVLFRQENIFRADISEASVVTMYLLSSVNKRLRPRLFEQLKPGTRIVSHQFDMGEWEPENSVAMEGPSGTLHEIFMWIMPARVEGHWVWTLDENQYHLEIQQQYQE